MKRVSVDSVALRNNRLTDQYTAPILVEWPDGAVTRHHAVEGPGFRIEYRRSVGTEPEVRITTDAELHCTDEPLGPIPRSE